MRFKPLFHVFVFFVCFLIFVPNAFATHLIGGDITYKCLGNNQFQITLTLYQDCLNGSPLAIQQDNPAQYAVFTRGLSPALVQYGQAFAVDSGVVDPNFSNNCIDNYPNVCMRMEKFIFTITLPPSNVGYYIVYQRCCRNGAISNVINSGNIGVTYLATIPPFQSGQCPNSSAVFNNVPPQIICANNPFVYDFSATDPDGDSLSYTMCAAHPGGSVFNPLPTGPQMTPPPYASVQYGPAYSASQPVPGTPPLQINPTTGIMTGTPSQIGRFVVTVCVHEWRNGQMINTVSRDVQFVITDCSKKVLANIPELSYAPNTFEINCKNFTVHFVNTSQGADTYLWKFGVPGATSTQFEPTYTYPDTGTYSVKLIVNPGTTCSDSITRLVKIYPVFRVGFTYSGKLCPGEPIHFTDTSFATYPPIISWRWDYGDSSAIDTIQNPTHIFTLPGGSHTVTLSAETKIGCRDTASVTVPVDYLNVFAGNDTVIVKGYPFQLHGTGASSYLWTPTNYLSNANIANPDVNFPDTGVYEYVLTGSTVHGCSAKDSIKIRVVNAGSIFVPTAFTPNGDGLNDVLIPKIVGYALIDKFSIFNRYGQLMYASFRNNKPQWNGRFHGKPCDLGAYYWTITATDARGEKITQNGSVTLIR